MYFDASERIAHKTSYPRSQIEKIDDFLAGQDIKRFELRQLQEKTELYTDVSPILEAYIRERVLSKETVYLCPEHLITLEPANRNEGRCTDCDRVYPFEDCSIKLVYERVRQPDRYKASKLQNHFIETKAKEIPWYKQPSNVLAVVAIIVSLICGFIQITPILFPALNQQTDNLTKTPTMVVTVAPTLDITPDPTIEMTVMVEETSLPEALLLTPEVTSSVTSEVVEVGVEETTEITITVEKTSLPVATAETTPELAGTP